MFYLISRPRAHYKVGLCYLFNFYVFAIYVYFKVSRNLFQLNKSDTWPINKQTNKHTNKQKNKQTNKQTNKTNKQD